MDDFILARALHVLSVLLWIGGVAFVTTVVLPATRRNHPPGDRTAAFHRIEAGFAWQARLWVLLAGASGFWMVYRGDMWGRFLDPHFWWMHAMVGLWLVFMVMLFAIEPLVLHPLMAREDASGQSFEWIERLHRLLFLVALVTVFGAVAGSHGFF
ncbi:hypothetical protein [Sphingomonas sp. NPDC079357]|uniref:hypothetical protein n=1 Tax=Sphingomonas sp. NPDC079357 TaxID=3364518 RepID=UPI003850319F